MQLSKERIEEFRKIVEEDYDIKLKDDEAECIATDIANFFYTLWQIDQRSKK